jgi:hypothetical protein
MVRGKPGYDWDSVSDKVWSDVSHKADIVSLVRFQHFYWGSSLPGQIRLLDRIFGDEAGQCENVWKRSVNDVGWLSASGRAGID